MSVSGNFCNGLLSGILKEWMVLHDFEASCHVVLVSLCGRWAEARGEVSSEKLWGSLFACLGTGGVVVGGGAEVRRISSILRSWFVQCLFFQI
jgi:hypothetical protein